MTTAHRDQLADDYRAHLPAWAQRALTPTDRVAHFVTVAVTHGWTVEQLVAESTTGLERHHRPGGVITYRLERASAQPPPTTTAPAKARPFCTPDCAARAGWIEDDRGRPIRKCDCRSSQ